MKKFYQEITKNNLYLNNNSNVKSERIIFKDKCIMDTEILLNGGKLPISDTRFYKYIIEKSFKLIVSNLEYLVMKKKKLNEIIESSIAKSESKFSIVFPGLVSKIIDNKISAFKKDLISTGINDQIDSSCSDSSMNDSIQLKDENIIKIEKPSFKTNLCVRSDFEEDYKTFLSRNTEDTNKKLPKIYISSDIEGKNIKDLKLKKSLINDNGYNTNSNINIISQIVKKPKVIVNEYEKNIINKNDILPKRKDHFGNIIVKGSKRHKLVYLDQIGQKFLSIINIESYKQYNLIKKSKEQDIQYQKDKVSCCIIN